MQLCGIRERPTGRKGGGTPYHFAYRRPGFRKATPGYTCSSGLLAGRWRAVKSAFTHAAVKSGVAVAHNEKGEYALWQRRYWEHTIANEGDFRLHVDYIHFNPVKHGWAKRVTDWPYLSFHSYVAHGILPPDWATGDEPGEYGEV